MRTSSLGETLTLLYSNSLQKTFEPFCYFPILYLFHGYLQYSKGLSCDFSHFIENLFMTTKGRSGKESYFSKTSVKA